MAAARCTSGVNVAAARGSSWFSRKRARWSWKSRPAQRCSRTGRAWPSPGGRRAACRRRSRSPAAEASTRGPSRPRRGRGSRDSRRERPPWPGARTPGRRCPRSSRRPRAGRASPCRSGRRRTGARSAGARRASPPGGPGCRSSAGACPASRRSTGRARRPGPRPRPRSRRGSSSGAARRAAPPSRTRTKSGCSRNPGVVRRHVVRDEVEDRGAGRDRWRRRRSRASAASSAEVLVDPVVPDREAGAADVCLAEVREDAAVLGEPLGIRSRDAPGRLAGLPHAEEPDEVEPVRGQPVELRVGDASPERGPSPQRGVRSPTLSRTPHADLEQCGIPGRGNGLTRCGLRIDATCFPVSGLLPPSYLLSSRAESAVWSRSPSSRSLVSRHARGRSRRRAIKPVHPVWWLAPSPAPLSPWKYS